MTMQGAVRTFMGRRERDDRTTVLVIGGMHSAACVGRVQTALRGASGVETVGVNLLTRLATVRHGMGVRPSDLLEAVAGVGYQATLASPGPELRSTMSFGDTINVIASRKSRFVAGAIFTLLILIVRSLGGSPMLLFLLATPVQVTVGWDYYRGFFHALKRGYFNLDSLIVIGASAAYIQGFACFAGYVMNDPDLMAWKPQFHTAAIILTVVSLGKWLESRARESTTPLWGSLSELTPREAIVIRDGREQTIPTGVVALGDTVIVKPHSRVPVDGEVIDGVSDVDESLITGDTHPHRKMAGDRVIVASLNGAGILKIKATGVGEASTLAQISQMVHTAQARKGRFEQMADRIAAILVPLTVLIAGSAFVLWYFGPIAAKSMEARGWISPAWADWIRHSAFAFLFQESSLPKALVPAISVLVASCPYALGLATPMVVIIACGIGARRGIVFKGGEALEGAARVTDVVFSKISTVTDGTFAIKEIIPTPGVDRDYLMTVAASLEQGSEHGLAKGMVKEAKRTTLTLRKVSDLQPVPSRGLKGMIGRRNYLLGSLALMTESKFKLSEEMTARVSAAEAEGCTIVILAEEFSDDVNESGVRPDAECPGRILGAIALADRVKESTLPAIAELRKNGIRVHLLSGRSAPVAQNLGAKCGFETNEIHAEMLLEKRVEFTHALQEKTQRVGAVGDGVDDAPVLAAAEVGLALGVGTEGAVEAGEILIVADDVRGVPRSLRLAHLASRTIKFNLFWALAFTVVLIPMSFLDRIDPTLSAAFMAFSSILVVLNALRLTYARIE